MEEVGDDENERLDAFKPIWTSGVRALTLTVYCDGSSWRVLLMLFLNYLVSENYGQVLKRPSRW